MPIFFKSGSLNLLEPSGPVQGCNGIDLPFLRVKISLCGLELREVTGRNGHHFLSDSCVSRFLPSFQVNIRALSSVTPPPAPSTFLPTLYLLLIPSMFMQTRHYESYYVGYSESKYCLRISLAHPRDRHFAHVQ